MAVDYILKVEGVDGESKLADHEDEIDVLAWSWGMSQSGTMHMGGGGGAGKVDIQDISITKYVDKATPILMKMCCSGEHVNEVEFTARKAGKNPIDYLRIKLTAVIVSSISTGGSSGEERITENVTFNFAKYEASYTPQKEDGSGDASIDTNWNIEKNIEE